MSVPTETPVSLYVFLYYGLSHCPSYPGAHVFYVVSTVISIAVVLSLLRAVHTSRTLLTTSSGLLSPTQL